MITLNREFEPGSEQTREEILQVVDEAIATGTWVNLTILKNGQSLDVLVSVVSREEDIVLIEFEDFGLYIGLTEIIRAENAG